MTAVTPASGEPFADASTAPGVRGFLHPARSGGSRDGIVLAHGAGGNAAAPLLVALASALSARGITVLRCDLPFRQARPTGPPRPGDAAIDREGLRHAVAALRRLGLERVFAGGHSYGGRQASMLAADTPGLVDALLLLSYPLHPPRRPDQPRTAHLPRLETPTLLVHGATDGFGSRDEIDQARRLIPARTKLLIVERAGHDLLHGRRPSPRAPELVAQIVDELLAFV